MDPHLLRHALAALALASAAGCQLMAVELNAQPTTADAGRLDAGARCPDKETVRARISACVAADTQQECETRGGTWVGAFSRFECACPTGQDGCECDSDDPCLGICALPTDRCSGAVRGRCSAVYPVSGTWCWVRGAAQGGTTMASFD